MSASFESAAGQLVLAVDAGGTKTDACLAIVESAGKFRILGRGRTSAGNPLSIGFAASAAAIGEAVQLARRQAGVQTAKVPRAVLSIAGAAGAELRSEFRHWAHENQLAERVAIVSDILPILVAGTPNGCGVALVSGTGSVAFGRSADGRTTLVGGWGYILGDDGSGFAIGRAALRFALEDLESHPEPQLLTRTVLSELRAKSTRDVTEAVYRDPEPRAIVASLTPKVIELASCGDDDAEAILDVAAHDLAQIAARVTRNLGLADGSCPLALGGGVLVASLRLQQQVVRELQQAGLSPESCVVADPLAGCLRLADPAFGGAFVDWSQQLL